VSGLVPSCQAQTVKWRDFERTVVLRCQSSIWYIMFAAPLIASLLILSLLQPCWLWLLRHPMSMMQISPTSAPLHQQHPAALPISPAMTSSDESLMRRCVTLATRALGRTRPNPPVGCVIVTPDGRIVGEGYHPKAGEPHAEVFALRQAGDLARGSTAYVSLEPCSHHGRTPPCCDALLAAGVARVVAGVVDPNPRVSGGGLAKLREHGVEVTVMDDDSCREVLAPFFRRIGGKSLYGSVMGIVTDDGFEAMLPWPLEAMGDDCKWESSEVPLMWQQRVQADAVVIDCDGLPNTSSLIESAARLPASVARVLLIASAANLPTSDALRLLAKDSSLLIFCGEELPSELSKEVGARVLPVGGDVPVQEVADLLNGEGMMSVAWAVGDNLRADLLQGGLVQRLVFVLDGMGCSVCAEGDVLGGWGLDANDVSRRQVEPCSDGREIIHLDLADACG